MKNALLMLAIRGSLGNGVHLRLAINLARPW